MTTLSIIIPSLNEAEKLPLLLADLSFFTDDMEIIISDSGSKDQTELITKIAGVKFIKNAIANRGIQLHQGALKANGDWLLFLHADSKIPKSSLISIQDTIKSNANKSYAWFFNLRIIKKGIMFRLLELAVYIRSNILKEPYGDQGLLISRENYSLSGGYKDLYLMEDIDLISRLSTLMEIRSIGKNLYTDARKWDGKSILKNAIQNARLKRKWRRGEDSKSLWKEYYSEKKNYKVNKF